MSFRAQRGIWHSRFFVAEFILSLPFREMLAYFHPVFLEYLSV